METVCVCSGCARTIDSKFLYCPWCGLSQAKDNGKAMLDNVFDKLEEKICDDRQMRIKRMESKLDKLEQDLDALPGDLGNK